MFPNFYHLFKDLFGLEIPGLVFINTFGFFVAVSFLVTSWVMAQELKRKEKEGHLAPMMVKTTLGEMPGLSEYFFSGLVAFVFGWKFIYLIINSSEFFSDPQSHILSMEGSLFWGLLLAAISTAFTFYQGKKIKKKYPEPKEVENPVHPYERMGTITLYAAVAGLLGAKIFDHMEHWDQFIANPLGAFLDPFSGLTFYGGLICGGAAVLIYANSVKINWRHMLDVGGPAMMLAYGIGRIGCHMSGDGDWGIVNKLSNPGWLPDWLWAYTYPNNVANICDPETGMRCAEGVRPLLSSPVWPTPLYEAILGVLLFAFLWKIRKRFKVPGVLFCIYLILVGFERFWIEKIRVNAIYEIAGMEITQAELISVGMMLLGAFGWWYFVRDSKKGKVGEKIKTEM
ncbi:MAG: phosphatidylglycerol:prolipoprotein diacylglycerol transferase [Bacteroidia bacterium]|jgi:phosphatidylglycerol:prolipoprotein diacylglycerol transferase